MTLLLPATELLARRKVAAGVLHPLASSLREELAPFVLAPPSLPRDKALLSRTGGRCSDDQELLAYDPWHSTHLCPRCGRAYRGEMHDLFRLYWHQLWLAERTLHSVLLGVVLDDVACRDAATMMLERYARRYLDYPNRDNVLGPSRPFFSTYLESIWLLQIMIALDLLEAGAPSAALRTLGADVRATVIAPSAELIASYDEGMSNRQVWNNAALLAASVLLDEPELRERVLHGPSGLQAHLEHALLPDGSWYEGENYHLFAHRGLWYGVQMAERLGHELPAELSMRFDEGFVTPFRTMLPDLTLPSRRDSQYAISVRQPRFAESCELGLRRTGDARLAGILAQLYDPLVPRGDTGRSRSTADVERNLPPTGLTRADLSWRALLLALPALPAGHAPPLESDLLPSQGIAVLRKQEGRIYAALDYGHSGGNHGHPDRLQLLLSVGTTRVLDDPGTGSYVEPSLHWYRSTLAHCAPIIDGESQPRVDGRLLAFDTHEGSAWASAEAHLADALVVRRTLVLLDDHLVDMLEWDSSTGAHDVVLPLNGIEVVRGADEPRHGGATSASAFGLAGEVFAWLHEVASICPDPGAPIELRLVTPDLEGALVRGWITTSADPRWWRALAPGPPSNPSPRPITLVHLRGRRGSIRAVWSWGDVDAAPRFDEAIISLTTRTGSTITHARTVDGWRILRDSLPPIELAGVSALARESRTAVEPPHRAIIDPPFALSRSAVTFAFGEPHYRRSEETWGDAGRPDARVTLVREIGDALVIEVAVRTSHVHLVAMDAENPLDNEAAPINGDGVQLYFQSEESSGAWLLVPLADSSGVGDRAIDGWGSAPAPACTWSRSDDGYSMTARLPLPLTANEFALDVLVNLSGPGRARRLGQLVLSGAVGEFVYLRGDRHEPSRLLRFVLVDD